MKEQRVNFETAVLAKEKGLCTYFEHINGTGYVPAFYSEDGIEYEETEFQQEDCVIEDRYLRPTQSLLQKWIREVHSIDVLVDKGFLSNKYSYEVYRKNVTFDSEYIFKTYEEALEIGLYEALKLI